MKRKIRMILHTIISEYDIFNNTGNVTQNEFMDIAGGQLEYRNINGNKEIVRLHSTDPYKYLMDEYNPYTIIK